MNSDLFLKEFRKTVKKKKINWRSFWNGEDGASGPISEEWNVQTDLPAMSSIVTGSFDSKTLVASY